MLRLQKYLAECGTASRRHAEEMILAGRVKVNGVRVRESGTKVDPDNDDVAVDGKIVERAEKKVYIKLNKPRGYVSSCVSERGERAILDLVKDVPFRLYPVGRLDMDSEGLILLTNDGELANKLMHPRFEHEKEYAVNVQLPISIVQLKGLSSGVVLDGKKTLPAKVKQLGVREFSIVLREGRKRQIRRMVEKIGNKVVRLVRTRIGKVCLGDLPAGKYAYLTEREIEKRM